MCLRVLISGLCHKDFVFILAMSFNLFNQSNLEFLKSQPDNSIDSIVTDPPYGISFMGKSWDYDVPSVDTWKELMRVLKPGGHILVACGTRTQHRMAVNIEDAGFEIRDIVAWVYGSGFPKSLNIGKAVDKLQGNEREDLGEHPNPAGSKGNTFPLAQTCRITKGTSEWEGWGTALKPAMELWTLARKPLSEKTVAENVLKWGVGGINIDECRVGNEVLPEQKASQAKIGTFERENMITPERTGRFPANFIHDGSDEVVSMFPESKAGKNKLKKGTGGIWTKSSGLPCGPEYGDSGSASRFFYTAKASKSERNAGLDGFEEKIHSDRKAIEGVGANNPRNRTGTPKSNFHPTVKPIALMRYLTRLITPKGGVVLDPYMGSGSTGIACVLEGFNFIGVEMEKEYFEIAKARIEHWTVN